MWLTSSTLQHLLALSPVIKLMKLVSFKASKVLNRFTVHIVEAQVQ